MEVYVIDKTVIESINSASPNNHKANIIELKDGRFVTPIKIYNSKYFAHFKFYLSGREIIQIELTDIKPEENGIPNN